MVKTEQKRQNTKSVVDLLEIQFKATDIEDTDGGRIAFSIGHFRGEFHRRDFDVIMFDNIRMGEGFTQEQYDISKLSLMIFYNLPEYYRGKAQEYFDQMFTKAVIHRFIPFYFQGRLTTKFEKIVNVDKLVSENSQIYKDVIATLNYFRQNRVNTIAFDIPASIVFTDQLSRYGRTFNVILKYVSAYARTQEEFNALALELYDCYKKYETLLISEKSIS